MLASAANVSQTQCRSVDSVAASRRVTAERRVASHVAASHHVPWLTFASCSRLSLRCRITCDPLRLVRYVSCQLTYVTDESKGYHVCVTDKTEKLRNEKT